MNDLIELILHAFTWVSLAAGKTVPLFAIVLLLTALLRKPIPARVHCLLWMVVVARLLLPVSFAAPIAMETGVQSLLNRWIDPTTPAPAPASFDTFQHLDDQGKFVVVQMPWLPLDASPAEAERIASQAIVTRPDSLDVSDAVAWWQPTATGDSSKSIFEWIGLAVFAGLVGGWLIGFAYLTGRGVLSYFRFMWRLRRSPIIDEPWLIDRVLRACDKVGVGRRPLVREVAALQAPAIFGLFRPVICLPADWREQLAGDRLDWALRHELAHARRRDGLVLSIAGLARAVHCFHPLSWIAFAKLQHSMEQAADELATRDLEASRIREYGELLVQYASKPCRPTGTTVGLLPMAIPRGLHRRIESLVKQRPRYARLRQAVLLPVVAIIAASGLSDAETVQPPRQPKTASFDADTVHQWPWAQRLSLRPEVDSTGAPTGRYTTGPQQLDPAETLSEESLRPVAINVDNVLAKIRSIRPEVDADQQLLQYFLPIHDGADDSPTAQLTDGVLTAMLTEQRETLVRSMLAAVERSGFWQIVTEVQVIEIDVQLLNQFDWDLPDPTVRSRPIQRAVAEDVFHSFPMPDEPIDQTGSPRGPDANRLGPLPFRVKKVSRQQSERLVNQVRQDERSQLIQAPRVTLFNGQPCHMTNSTAKPFVTDISSMRGDFAVAWQPHVSLVDTGWALKTKPVVTEDEKVSLQLLLSHSEVESVRLASLPGSVSLADQERAVQPDVITIQVPNVRVDSVAVDSVLSDDETLLIFLPTPYAVDTANEGKSSEQAIGKAMGQVWLINVRKLADAEPLALLAN